MNLMLRSIIETHSLKFATLQSEISVLHQKMKEAERMNSELSTAIKRKQKLNHELIERIEKFDRVLQSKMKEKARKKNKNSGLAKNR